MNMEKIEELLAKIPVSTANLEQIKKDGKISGCLAKDITELITHYFEPKKTAGTERIMMKFEDIEGNEIFINPRHIISIQTKSFRKEYGPLWGVRIDTVDCKAHYVEGDLDTVNVGRIGEEAVFENRQTSQYTIAD